MWVSLIQHGIIIWNILYTASTTHKLYLYISQNHRRKKWKYITSFPTFWSFTFDLTEQFSFHFSFLCRVGENEKRFFFIFFPEMMSVSWDVLLFSTTIFIHHLIQHILWKSSRVREIDLNGGLFYKKKVFHLIKCQRRVNSPTVETFLLFKRKTFSFVIGVIWRILLLGLHFYIVEEKNLTCDSRCWIKWFTRGNNF